MEKKPKLTSVVGIYSVGAALIIFGIMWVVFWHGLTIHLLWQWYGMPLTGVESPGVIYCAALAMILRHAIHGTSLKEKGNPNIANTILAPAFGSCLILAIWFLIRLLVI